MCVRCHLVTPCGTHDVCHACAITLRAEIRRGLRAIAILSAAAQERGSDEDDPEHEAARRHRSGDYRRVPLRRSTLLGMIDLGFTE
jgi:hypothetical protein